MGGGDGFTAVVRHRGDAATARRHGQTSKHRLRALYAMNARGTSTMTLYFSAAAGSLFPQFALGVVWCREGMPCC